MLQCTESTHSQSLIPVLSLAAMASFLCGFPSPFDGAGSSAVHEDIATGDSAPITERDVRTAQKAWADAIKAISKTYLDGGDYVGAAGKAAGELYGYGHTNVMFKPTKAKDVPFRPDASQAMSYFVGAKAVSDGIAEDGGFAINGGKGWSDVVL